MTISYLVRSFVLLGSFLRYHDIPRYPTYHMAQYRTIFRAPELLFAIDILRYRVARIRDYITRKIVVFKLKWRLRPRMDHGRAHYDAYVLLQTT
jgi:hypothetical protein